MTTSDMIKRLCEQMNISMPNCQDVLPVTSEF
jgi:hypothetical protein